MRILIIGAGNAGRQLAAKLCHEKHDVVMIDNHSEPLEEIESQQDILTIRGPGSSPRTLEEAEVSKADLLVAVTNHDEVNILAGIFAHSAGVPHSIVRVANRSYLESGNGYDLQSMGIDLAVSQKAESAREMFNVLCRPGTHDVIDLLDGQIQALGIKVHTDSPLILAPLKDFPKPELIKTIRFIAVMRGDKLVIPSGETQFLIGDDIYFVGQPDDLNELMDWADPEHLTFQKVVISGGGDVGLRLAQMLEEANIKTVLVEVDPQRAELCARELNKSLIIKGDALDQETLSETGLDEKSAFVATTGDDENNIICCLVAEKLGASFTLAQITKSEYAPIINSSSLLDRAVSPHSAMINAILQYIRGRNVQAASMLHTLPGELLEVDLPAGSEWVGKSIKELSLPDGDIVAAVLRDGKTSVATGNTELQGGDRLVIFSKPEAFKKLESAFRQ